MKSSPQVIPMADSSEQISPDDLIPTFLPDAFLRSEAAFNMQRFKLPRYDDLPEIPLYREQVISYIEGVFEPLSCCVEGPWITPSMVNNYVKAGLVPPPVKKLYGKDQLALLVAICIFKQALSMSAIEHLFKIQRITYRNDIAYNYTVREVTNSLSAAFTSTFETSEDSAKLVTRESLLVRSAAIAFASRCYLMAYLRYTGLDKS